MTSSGIDFGEYSKYGLKIEVFKICHTSDKKQFLLIYLHTFVICLD